MSIESGGLQMGQFNKTGIERVLSSDEARAVVHLTWIWHTLGGADPMMKYLAAMMIAQIQSGPAEVEQSSGQFALRVADATDGSSI